MSDHLNYFLEKNYENFEKIAEGGESSAMKITCSIIFYKVLGCVDNAAATCIKRIQDIN